MEISKQKLREAGMAHAKLILGPDEFKKNKAAALAIQNDYVAGAKWIHVQTEKKLRDLEADKNLVLEKWDEANKRIQDMGTKAHTAGVIIRNKFKELTAAGSFEGVFDLLNQIEPDYARIGLENDLPTKEIFCKVFETLNRQILVTKEYEDDDTDCYKIQVLIYNNGLRIAMAFGYDNEKKRDEFFNNYTKAQAVEFVTKMLGATGLEVLNG